MYFNLYNGVDLINGENNYLIINVFNKEIYSIDKKFYSILKKCEKGQKIEELTNDTDFLLEKMKFLETNKIGYIFDSFDKKDSVEFSKKALGMVWLNVTSRCNYKCIHCYENAGRCNVKETLSLNDYDNMINKLTSEFKINCFQITGGEPLLRGKEFIENLLKIISKHDVGFIEIYTNLSLLDNDYLEMFKKYNVHVATSLYSQNEKVHDEITGINGSYKLLMHNLAHLKKMNIPFRIGIIIMKQNEKEKDTLRDWANKKFDLKERKQYDIVRPVGRARIVNLDNQKLFQEKYYIKNNNFLPYNFQTYMYNKIFNSCWGDKVCIKSNGEIYPCVMSNVKVGNYKDIIGCLTRKNSYRFLTKDKIHGCKKCEYRYLCTECRAIYTQNKKELKDKPFVCMYNTKTNEFRGE